MESAKKMVKRTLPEKMTIFLKRLWKGNYCFFFNIFNVKPEKIVVCSYYGDGFGCNGKYIVQALLKKKPHCDIVWLLKSDLLKMTSGNDESSTTFRNAFPPQVRFAEYGSLNGLMELATAGIWIDNCRKNFYPPKKRDQFYLQTWHGGPPVKKIEKDAQSQLPSDYLVTARLDSSMIDLMLSNCSFTSQLCRSSFWYRGEIMECGYPRNDILLNPPEHISIEIRNHFNIAPGKGIVLYAPTFRNDFKAEFHGIDFEGIMKSLNDRFGSEWVFLVKMHPNVALKSSGLTFNRNVIDASSHKDMQELMLASDVIITDYSSVMFEFMLLRRPVFLYLPDTENYRKERNLYFEITDLPFPAAESNIELTMNIVKFNEEMYQTAIERFIKQAHFHEKGSAADLVARRILQIIDENLPDKGKRTDS